ncbi:amidohydrolase [Salicibibacter cibarius]|uniref:Amidohydrolase n=1 Tax=Salicibibacter cibarius TaxID=2743000 RepID=A0A7T6Z3Z8_9BACI|nr:amidohydrolase family protein [Salicibibacter cibarius]QQK76603.1 amidohydrolase [Salicibibacter cibarius]
MAEIGKPNKLNGIIDCDVHPIPRKLEELHAYLPSRWHKHYVSFSRPFYNHPHHVLRLDALPEKGGAPGSDPDFLREQLINQFGIDYAILLPIPNITMWPNPTMAADLARAYNQWLADKWLDNNNFDGRFKGSITVAPQDPQAAVREIEHWASHPHMVQVLTDSGSDMNYGHKQFHPIYEACEHFGLPFAIHPTSEGLGINSPASPGYPTTYFEWSTSLTFSVQAHLVSFISEGVFERFPGLKVALVEGGSSWLAPLLWRLDEGWRGLRNEVPWVKKRPSEYVRENVRVTSQPLHSPENKEHLLQIFDMMNAKEVMMYASDYPHWDFDSPIRTFPKMDKDLKNRIFYENAKEFYKLP